MPKKNTNGIEKMKPFKICPAMTLSIITIAVDKVKKYVGTASLLNFLNPGEISKTRYFPLSSNLIGNLGINILS